MTPSAASPRSGSFYGWRIVAAAFLIYFVSGGIFSTSTVFFKALSAEFGWSRGQLSGPFSLSFVVAGVSAPLWGRIADRRGPRASFLPGAIVTGTACILLSRIWGIGSLYLLYAIFAFGSAGISVIPISVLLSNWFVQRRGRAIGIAYTGVGFGSLCLAPTAGVLVTRLGWRGSYVLAGLAFLLCIAPVALWVRNRPRDLGLMPDGATPGTGKLRTDLPPASSPGPELPLGAALATSRFWILAVCWMLTQAALMAVALHQVPLLTDQGFSTEKAALVAGAVGGMGILGRLGFGLLAERSSISRLYAGCYLMYAVGIAFLWAAARFGRPALVLYAAVFGIAVGGSWVLSPLLVGELFGAGALGEIFGLLGLAATLGGAVGGTGAGVLFDHTGDYELVLGLCSALSLLGAVLMLRLGRSGPG